ncbi:MAG TPA: hypothetical protein VNN25_21885 [Thermoanaerobaculia bacterium]|nr:hypothetical protein [Thermoanaerobaculia bacterium]
MANCNCDHKRNCPGWLSILAIWLVLWGHCDSIKTLEKAEKARAEAEAKTGATHRE